MIDIIKGKMVIRELCYGCQSLIPVEKLTEKEYKDQEKTYILKFCPDCLRNVK